MEANLASVRAGSETTELGRGTAIPQWEAIAEQAWQPYPERTFAFLG